MTFGEVPLAEASGGLLAHSVALPDGRLRKGRVLTAQDIATLQAAGVARVTVARLGPGDIDEDSAAERLARAIVPDPDAVGLRLGRAATGRVNIHALAPGIAEVRAARIHAANAVDPMITVATVPPWQRMEARGMVATVKIISYGVRASALEAACLAGERALAMRAPQCRSAQLIQTAVSADETGDKGQMVTKARLDRLGIDIGPLQVVPHDVPSLTEAILAAKTDAVLILTGSATSDIADVAPEALRAAGGTVAHFGMPVDPGNLLFYGDFQGRPVIGLPGCARAPALNGADWVMERLFCGVPVSPRDVAAMGVGGLLKEVPQRGRLREA